MRSSLYITMLIHPNAAPALLYTGSVPSSPGLRDDVFRTRTTTTPHTIIEMPMTSKMKIEWYTKDLRREMVVSTGRTAGAAAATGIPTLPVVNARCRREPVGASDVVTVLETSLDLMLVCRVGGGGHSTDRTAGDLVLNHRYNRRS